MEEYISSGVMEAYALGELSSKEREEVERNILQYPELREELRKIEIAQEKLIGDLSIQPGSNIKEKIFHRINEQSNTRITSVANRNVWLPYALAACIALALVSSTLALWYYYKWKAADSSLTELLVQNQRIASEFNSVNQRLDKIESDLKITTSPSFKRTVMTGTDNAPESLAYIYWNPSTQDVYLNVEKMRELSLSNQYQLWAIVDGKPVDAGVFDSNFSGLMKMNNISNATAFAVTVEKRGGAKVPSLKTLQVIGNVAKG